MKMRRVVARNRDNLPPLELLKFYNERCPFSPSNNLDFSSRITHILREPLVINLTSLFRVFPCLPNARPDGFDLAATVFKHYLIVSQKIHIQVLRSKSDPALIPPPRVSLYNSLSKPFPQLLPKPDPGWTSYDLSISLQDLETPDLSPVPRDSVAPFSVPKVLRIRYDLDAQQLEDVWDDPMWPNYHIPLPPLPPPFQETGQYSACFTASPPLSPFLVIEQSTGDPVKIFVSVTSRVHVFDRRFDL